MTLILIRKLLRDVRVPLLAVVLLLVLFQALWVKITERISAELMPMLLWLGQGRNISGVEIEQTLFKGPGKITKTIMGGEDISLFRVGDMVTVALVHPLTLIILCVWAIGRAAGAIAGEIDRGTMELLVAQPIARFRVVLAHLCVDLMAIVILCLSIWAGNALGIKLVDLREAPPAKGMQGTPIDAAEFGPALWNTAALIFAVSGVTTWLSARGRLRGRVLGVAVLLMLLQFLVNVVGQMWEAVAFLRPFTLFYYYQPQQIILANRWTVDLEKVWPSWQPFHTANVLVVLVTVGTVGYALAFRAFRRRDLPAPL